MRGGVDAVGSEAYAYQIVVLDVEVVAGGHADRRVGGQLHYTRVVGTYAQLILGAQHAERLHAADLAALDLELLVAAVGVEHRAHRGAQHFEPLAAVGRAAHDVERRLAAHVDRGYVQVIRVGMVLARENLADDHARESAADGLYLAEILHLETYVGEDRGDLFGRQVGVDILFQPVERYLHDM